MKRHDALIPLSHDHHHALVVALRLKKGSPASPHDTWPIDLEAQRKALFEFADRELLPHFMLEEEVLFPACSRSTNELQTVAADLGRDHDAMRRLLNEIRSAGLADVPLKMSALGVLLEAHIRKEERSFFPLVEQGIAENTLSIDLAALAAKHALYHVPPACDV